MQIVGNKAKYPLRTYRTGVWAALFSVLGLCLSATAVTAQRPAIVVSQNSLLGNITGGFTSGGSPAGGSFAVTQQGDVAVGTTYGGVMDLVDGVTGTVIPVAASNAAGVTIDSKNNLYFSNFYGATIEKIPYVNGSYPATAPSSIAACTGTDTVWCTLPNPGTNVKAMAFDAAGDLFMVTTANPGNKIYELAAATFYSGPPTLIYTDSNPVSSIALDSVGNLFYTDAVFTDSGQTNSSSSALNVLTYSGSAYATTPIVLVAYTPAAPGAYDSVLSGVAVDQNNTVYFADQSNGTFAFPNTGTETFSSGYVTANVYQVSAQTAYQITPDGKGNLYAVAYNNSAGTPAVYRILVNKVVAPASPIGTAATTTAFVGVNSSCTPTLAITSNQNGKSTNEFAGTLGTCAAQSSGVGAVFTGTFTFTPTTAGPRSALLTVTNSSSSTSSTVAVSGIGQGALLTLDPGATTAYKTGFTTPASAVADSSGDLFVADSGANKVFEIAAGTTTPVAFGTGFSKPGGVAFDAAGNLYIADTGNNQIVEIPNISGTLTPASQATLVASTVTFGGIALKSPTTLAVGPTGTLNIYDSGNNRIVTYAAGFTGIRFSGLTAPALGTVTGMAIDGSGNLYLAVPSLGEVLVYAGGTLSTTLSTGLTTPNGVTVDPSGSVLIADSGIPGIVRVPSIAGVLTPKSQVTIENVTAAPGTLTTDAAGDLFLTDATASAPAVYAIARTATAVNFGDVPPGTSSAALPIYAEDAGNAALTTPAIGTAVSAPFTLQAGTVNPCGSGSFATSVAVGTLCEFSAVYSPSSSATGTQTATSTLTAANAANVSSASVTLTGAAVATAGTSPQVIVFTPPPATIAYSSTPITLYAVATPSGLPITYTITGPASVTGNQLTFTNSGTVVVTASQKGSTTYAPATPVSYTITVTSLGTVATPTFSLAAGTYTFVPQSTTLSDTTPGAVIYCTTNGTTPTAASPVCSGTLSITATETVNAIAIAPGYANSSVATAVYTVAVQPAGLTVTINPATLSIVTSQRGAVDVDVSGTNGFNNTVTLSVAGLPSGASYSFTPATLSVSGTASSQSVLTIALAGATASLHRSNPKPLLPEAVLACALCFIGLRKRRGVMRLFLLLAFGIVGLNMLSGCSNSAKNLGTTTTVTVTATSGSVVQSATFPLTVTPN